jgi:hypothetical protein
MTRLDAIQGDTLNVQNFMVQQISHDVVPVTYPTLNTSSFGRTRIRRINESLSLGSPPLTKSQEASCFAEASLVIVLLGENKGRDPDAISVRKESAVEWFQYEKFPRKWKRSEKMITVDDMILYRRRITRFANLWSGYDCEKDRGEEELGSC